jgi:hypothetical protein
MAHTTQPHPSAHAKEHGHYGEPGAHHVPVEQDPEHDIDARAATIWVVGGAIVLFVGMWLLFPIFLRVQEAERMRKVDDTPNVELEQTRAAERAFLQGQNPTKKSIDHVIRK